MSKPRILIVGAFPPAGSSIFGGIVTSCRALLGSSLPRRADLVLVDSTQITHPPPKLLVRLLLAAKRFLEYIGKFERRRPDVVILFTAAGASVAEKGAMAWYARLRGVPALMFPRGGPVIDACLRSRWTRTWTRWAFRGARMVLCQGARWQEFAVGTLGFPARAAPIVPNWTASDELLAVGRVREYGARDEPRLLFVGWLDREKGVRELLEVCAELAARHAFRLDLVGEGNLSDEARSLMTRDGLAGRLHVHGWLQGERLLERYKAADIFVLPSWSEGLPNAMVEAMAAGLAVVVSAVGNIPAVVEDGNSGVLVPPRDPSALRTALLRVLEDASLRRSLGQQAHAVAAERFGVEPAVDRLLSAVNQVTGGIQRRARVAPDQVG